MREWRKLYSKMLASPDVARLSDGAALLLTFLIAAQDDTGYYGWDTTSVKQLILTRTWTLDEAHSYAQEMIKAGIASWVDDGIELAHGAQLNGTPRRDVHKLVYPRQRHVNATSTPRQQDVSQSRVDKSRVDKSRESAGAPAHAREETTTTEELIPLENPPDWLIELRRIPDWPKSASTEASLVEWEKQHNNGTSCLTVATALLSKWPGNPKRPYKDPVATFKNWLLRDGEKNVGHDTGKPANSQEPRYLRPR